MRFTYCFVVLVMACGGSAAPDPVPAAAGGRTAGYTRLAAAVYAALLDSVHTRLAPDTLLVADSTLTFRVPTEGLSSWHALFDSLPKGLAAALQATSRDKQRSATLPLPRPTQLITSATLREIFAGGISGGWAEFYRRYPRQRNYLRFSPVAFTTDSLDALVYYEYRCGGRCGGGNAVWLTRRDGTRWRVRKVFNFWIS